MLLHIKLTFYVTKWLFLRQHFYYRAKLQMVSNTLNFTQCTIMFGNLDTDSRNSLQNQELHLNLVPIWSDKSEICGTRHED